MLFLQKIAKRFIWHNQSARFARALCKFVGGLEFGFAFLPKFLFRRVDFCLFDFHGTTACEEAVVTDRFCFEHFFYSSAILILYLPIKSCQQDFYAF
jgi:hypothetical protein